MFPSNLGWQEIKTIYYLSRKRNNSLEDYYYLQVYLGEMLARSLLTRGIQLFGAKVLDLGYGFGGYATSFKNAGSCVIGVDILLREIPSKIPVICGDAIYLPLKDDYFDLILCTSLIEHVPTPELLVDEIIRITKPGGAIFLSFPPFYSPIGGHQFSPFHLLGSNIALWIFNKRNNIHKDKWVNSLFPIKPNSYSSAYGNWGLYPMTIRKANQIIQKLPVEIMQQSTRWLNINFSKFPLLNEFLTWHVQFLLKKK